MGDADTVQHNTTCASAKPEVMVIHAIVLQSSLSDFEWQQ